MIFVDVREVVCFEDGLVIMGVVVWSEGITIRVVDWEAVCTEVVTNLDVLGVVCSECVGPEVVIMKVVWSKAVTIGVVVLEVVCSVSVLLEEVMCSECVVFRKVVNKVLFFFLMCYTCCISRLWSGLL